MATTLVARNGFYLAARLRDSLIPSFRTYINDVVPAVLTAFCDLEGRADEVSKMEFERLGARPVTGDLDCDMGRAAEDAFDAGLAFYQMMLDFRQSTVNLLAVGLFHMVEQQLGDLSTDGLFGGLPSLKDSKLSQVKDWYERNLDLDLAEFPQWSVIDRELRCVANTVKHAEGSGARQLRAKRPEFFTNPILSEYVAANKWMRQFPDPPLRRPLTGEGLYVSDTALRDYGIVVVEFVEALATTFDRLGRYGGNV